MIHLAPKLDLPDSAVTQKFAFIGRSGSGKTYAAGKLAEGIFDAGGQLVVLDPVGVWWGLRLAANGKGKGLPIPVFGGLHEDIPLLPGGGAVVADTVVDAKLSVVLDVSMMRKGERVRFATDFAEQLFHRKKEKRSPMHLIVEEAQVFVPQRVRPEEARLLGAFEDLIKLGRNFGIGFSMVSQRPQAVNKDALNQTEVLIALQTTGPQERKALAEWIVEQGLDKELVDELPGLDIGTAYVWSPQWLKVLGKYRIGKKRTFNASSTPELGDVELDYKLAPVDLKAIQEKMSAAVDEARANDPKLMRAEMARLLRDRDAAEAQVKKLQEQLEQRQTAPEKIEVPVFKPEQALQLGKVAGSLTQMRADLQGLMAPIGEIHSRLHAFLMEQDRGRHPVNPDGHKSWRVSLPADPIGQGLSRHFERPSPHEPSPLRGLKPDLVVIDDPLCPPALRKGERKLLEVLAKGYPVRRTIAQAGTLADFSPSGGTFKTYLGNLKRQGLVRVEGKELLITAVGLEAAGGGEPLTGQDEIEMWRGALRKGERELLDVLIREQPNAVERTYLASEANMEASGGTFKTYLGTLLRNGLAEKAGSGVRLGSTFNRR